MNSRQQLILQMVIDQGRVSVVDLAKTTGVSEVTIRQDLNLLEKQSYLRRAHGYAVPLDSDDVETRMMNNYALKRELAEFAASLVNNGETVFIENGSSNALLARTLADQKNITIITVSSYIAHLLKETHCEVILLGGIYQKKSESMVGPLTRQYVQQVHFSKAFIGIDISPEGCIPVCGSMQGTFAAFLTCSQADHRRDTVLFIDPGFPVQKMQLRQSMS